MAANSINSNTSAMQAMGRLQASSSRLAQTFERLSSGMRINRASDDSAGLSVASALNTDVRVYTQAIRNGNDGLSMLNIADGAVSQLSDILQRLKELASQASNGVYSLTQRKALDSEAYALTNEYNRIISSSTFNGRMVIDGSLGTVGLQLGYGSSERITITPGSGLLDDIGTGSFQTASTFATGNIMWDVQSADVNNDGIADLISFENANMEFLVRLGNGDGTFRSPVTRSWGLSARNYTFVDINGDGKLDMAASADVAGQGSAWVFIGNGDGSFQAATSVITNSVTVLGQIVGADLNNDGKQDLVVADRTNGKVKVLIGNGNGTFAAAVSYSAGTDPNKLAIGDLNGDGTLDIITGSSTGADSLVILNGNGAGSFSSGTTIAGFNNISGVKLADINHDGYADILATTNGSSKLNTMLSNGNGTFQANVSYSVTGASDLVVGDLNGDGIKDVVASSSTGGVVFTGNGDGTLTTASTFSLMVGAPLGIDAADLNGDGVLDLLSGFMGAPSSIQLFFARTTQSASIGRLDLLLQSNAQAALTTIDSIMQRVTTERGNIGAAQSRLGIALSALQASREEKQASYSRIMDADVAMEAANMVRENILQQMGTAVLAQANQTPALLIKLLTGGA